MARRRRERPSNGRPWMKGTDATPHEGPDTFDGQPVSWDFRGVLCFADGAPVASPRGPEGPVVRLAGARVLPDGRMLSWTEDGILRVWDGTAAVPHALLDAHAGVLEDVAMLPHGRLASFHRPAWKPGPGFFSRENVSRPVFCEWDLGTGTCLNRCEVPMDGLWEDDEYYLTRMRVLDDGAVVIWVRSWFEFRDDFYEKPMAGPWVYPDSPEQSPERSRHIEELLRSDGCHLRAAQEDAPHG